MSYYKILGLEKEPFSTSPDPEFFYESDEHHKALMQLMIELRLKRGLCLILGDVGVGKTTLSRKLFQMLKQREDIIFYMILDPTSETEKFFLDSLIRTFKIKIHTPNPSVLDYKELLKEYLFQKGVEENKTVVLLIDEAQKLNSIALEILRVLLNYETNEYKLLQLILFAQMELLPRLREIKNFMDRICLKYVLNPLDKQETEKMINYRLKKAGCIFGPPFFSGDTISTIHRYTQGYPRQIAMLCHNALRTLVAERKQVVDSEMIRSIMAR